MLRINVANIVIEIDNKYETLPVIAKDYLSDKDADFSVSVSDEEIAREGAGLPEGFTKGELESIAVYRKIASRLPEYSAFVFHGSAVELDGSVYLFTAKSGVGKTTHTRLWLKKHGKRARVLNGDKPVIRIINGTAYVAGTPWRGKEGYGVPGMAPLAGIALLSRAEKNEAFAVSAEDALVRFITQAYIPRDDARSASLTVALLSEVLSCVPIISLRCNMEDDAADVAYRAFLKARFAK